MSEGSAKRHSDLNLDRNQNNDLNRSSYETGSRGGAAAHDPGQKTVTSKSNSMAAASKKDNSDKSQLTGKVVTKKKKTKAGGNAASGGNNSAHNNNNREGSSQAKNNSGKTTKKLTMAQINGAESEISGNRRDDAPIGSAAMSKKMKSTSSASMRNSSKQSKARAGSSSGIANET